MLNDEDTATVKYLRNSPKDALKKEAAIICSNQAYALDNGDNLYVRYGECLAAAHRIRAIKTATPQPFPAPAVQSGELPELPEPLELIWPDLNQNALGCGVEDRNLHDRYECAEYGWQNGMERAMECVPDDLYDGDQMRDYARQAIAQTAPAVAGEARNDLQATKKLIEDDGIAITCQSVRQYRNLLINAIDLRLTAAPSQGAKQ